MGLQSQNYSPDLAHKETTEWAAYSSHFSTVSLSFLHFLSPKWAPFSWLLEAMEYSIMYQEKLHESRSSLVSSLKSFWGNN